MNETVKQIDVIAKQLDLLFDDLPVKNKEQSDAKVDLAITLADLKATINILNMAY
jgi:hypothetical protein